MKANEIIEKLFGLANERDYSTSGDICLNGDPEAETEKVAVAMFGTPEVIKEAKAWGAQLLIVHEPVYHNKPDVNDPLDMEKRKFIDETGLTVYRYHDHTHHTSPDIIAMGELKKLDLNGRIETTDVFDLVRLHLENPMTPVELAKAIEEKLGIKHVRICGVRDIPCTVVSCMFGAPGNLAYEELKNEASEIVVVGETTEWLLGEYTRDAAQLGHKKALLILGHAGSERDGMVYATEILSDMFPEVTFKYIEGGELYTYTD